MPFETRWKRAHRTRIGVVVFLSEARRVLQWENDRCYLMRQSTCAHTVRFIYVLVRKAWLNYLSKQQYGFVASRNSCARWQTYFASYYGLRLCLPHAHFIFRLYFASFSSSISFTLVFILLYAVALFLRFPMESDRWANVVAISLVQLIISTRCVVNIVVGAVLFIVYPVCVVRVKPILFFFFSFLSFLSSFSLLATDIDFFSLWNKLSIRLILNHFEFVLCVKCFRTMVFQRCENWKKKKTTA